MGMEIGGARNDSKWVEQITVMHGNRARVVDAEAVESRAGGWLLQR
jgi:hypothetical protein